MDNIIDFFCSYKVGAICNFIIIIYGAILIKNIVIFLYKKSLFCKLKIFCHILALKIKEKAIILLFIAFLIATIYLSSIIFVNNFFINVNDIKTILLSSLTTILIIDAIKSFEKSQNVNFELVKNIFIEKCWNIFVILDAKEKGITNNMELSNYFLKLPTNNLTKNIAEKFIGFKTIYPNEKEYLKELYEKIPADIETLIKFVIPELYNVAISKKLLTKINQFNFELLRIQEVQQIKNNQNLAKKENSLNHLLHTIESLWESLYVEQEKFYK